MLVAEGVELVVLFDVGLRVECYCRVVWLATLGTVPAYAG